jgi:hypothetical protein
VQVRGRVVLEAIRFAGGVASKPSGVVSLWKSATGGKIVGCLPPALFPELPHAAGLLPITLESPGDRSLFSGQVDAWLVGGDSTTFPGPEAAVPRFEFPRVPPATIEEALDRIEAVGEWAGALSGSPPSEGGLWKSIRAYATRRSLLVALDERIARDAAFISPEERRDIVRAGIFLPPEAHSRLLASILGVDPEHDVLPPEGEKGDPLILLAGRLI